jgi:hypothetical protein
MSNAANPDTCGEARLVLLPGLVELLPRVDDFVPGRNGVGSKVVR